MSPEPKPKGEELVGQINNFSRQDRKNNILINRIKNNAKALIPYDSVRAYRALGMLSCFENDMSKVHSYHQKALKLSPSDYVVNLNYAQSLYVAGYFSEAEEYAQNVFDENRTGILEFLVMNSESSGRYDDSLKWINEWEKINNKNKYERKILIQQISGLLKSNHVSDDDVERLQSIAFSLLHEHNIYYTKKTIELLEDEESKWLNYMIGIDESVSEIVDLNEKLAERLADENLPSNLTSSVVIMYSSAS